MDDRREKDRGVYYAEARDVVLVFPPCALRCQK